MGCEEQQQEQEGSSRRCYESPNCLWRNCWLSSTNSPNHLQWDRLIIFARIAEMSLTELPNCLWQNCRIASTESSSMELLNCLIFDRKLKATNWFHKSRRAWSEPSSTKVEGWITVEDVIKCFEPNDLRTRRTTTRRTRTTTPVAL